MRLVVVVPHFSRVRWIVKPGGRDPLHMSVTKDHIVVLPVPWRVAVITQNDARYAALQNIIPEPGVRCIGVV